MNQRLLVSILHRLSGIASLIAAAVLLLDLGFHLSAGNRQVFQMVQEGLLYYFLFDFGIRLMMPKRLTYILTHPTDMLILTPFVLPVLFPSVLAFASVFTLFQLTLLAVFIGRIRHVLGLVEWLQFKPAQSLAFAFVLALFVGSLLLSLPIAMVIPESVTYLNALFTATSAICVTGLVTLDIGATFSVFGQVVILILIQVGGLGIMSFSALLAVFLRGKISQKQSMEFQQNYAAMNSKEVFRSIKIIFYVTFLLEAIGALFLAFAWHDEFDGPLQTLFMSIFHSVSAFCNAGFSLFPDSLYAFGTQTSVILPVSALIIIGGIGFPVMLDVFHRVYRRKKTHHHLRLQTKLALRVSALLLVVGTGFVFFTEYSGALIGYTGYEKLLLSFFQSVSARTAGFNTLDLTDFMPSTLLIIVVLMYIGASPGSTGGGIKTTTLGLVFTSFINTMRGKKNMHLWGRAISRENIERAAAIIFLSALIVTAFSFALLLTENRPFFEIFFEVVSAFGTVGLSLGVTSDLSNAGKFIIILLMFVGRVGPLTIAFALSTQHSEPNYEFPEENILIT